MFKHKKEFFDDTIFDEAVLQQGNDVGDLAMGLFGEYIEVPHNNLQMMISGGGVLHKQVAMASDVIIIHGNGLDRERYYMMIKNIAAWNLNKPVVCNEDSPCFSFVDIAEFTHTSWGYYNNMTKQEPPTYWGITRGEDEFFAWRMANTIGIPQAEIAEENKLYIQGLTKNEIYNDQQWVRLASLYPEHIDYIDFFCDNKFIDRSYGEPFMAKSTTTWLQDPHIKKKKGEVWRVVVNLKDGTSKTLINNGF